MAVTKVAILPLPGKSQIMEGKYGLELTRVRGVIRIHYGAASELNILDLSLTVEGNSI